MIYCDLLEIIGGLFLDMMDNNLNYLMKYLDLVVLVVVVLLLIVGFWGINIGGLFGKDNMIGMILVFGLVVLVGIFIVVYFLKKDFLKIK